ncbi:MAG: glycosyltransferase [bacterium]|nr:glycosyltransferase [bacterium]
MYLSWIIPTYNEERRIDKTLREVDEYLRSKNPDGGYEIMVVDSSSKDKTAEIVKNLQSTIQNLQLLTVENKGKGWAVREGMLKAEGSIRIFSDADNSTAPTYFDDMELLFKKGFDLIISSRNPKDVEGATRDIKEPFLREIMGSLGNILIQTFGVWGIWDTQNGFKALTAQAAEHIFTKTKMKGFSFDIEVLALARRLGYKIGIIPIRWRFDPDSKVTLSAYLKVFIDVFKIRWNLITGKYK